MKIAEYRAAQAVQMSEDELQAEVIDIAVGLQWLLFHDNDSRRNRAGLPDLIMTRRGRLIMAELKSQKGRMRPAQHVWADRLNQVEVSAHGAFQVFLWRPLDLIEGRIVDVLR